MEWEETGKLRVGVRGKELRWKKGRARGASEKPKNKLPVRGGHSGARATTGISWALSVYRDGIEGGVRAERAAHTHS